MEYIFKIVEVGPHGGIVYECNHMNDALETLDWYRRNRPDREYSMQTFAQCYDN